jgi:hypothetical protein
MGIIMVIGSTVARIGDGVNAERMGWAKKKREVSQLSSR